jgi:chemotaxis protein histidine kinase CheA
MSDEFLKVARQEIQSEIDGLNEAFLECIDDEQFYKKSKEMEKHMHKIKGLAPMMGHEKVGEIAQISDIILKHIINQGVLKGSQKIVFEAVQRMSLIFNGDADIETDDFRKQVMDTYPDITGL